MQRVYPIITLAPQEYRYALDAAMAVCGGRAPLVHSHLPELTSEVRWRIPKPAEPGQADIVLWIEPLLGTWKAELRELRRQLPLGGRLITVASRPLARRLPERRLWNQRGLGLQAGGITRLLRSVVEDGLRVEACYGMHSATSIVLNQLAECVARFRPALGDRLQFAARLRYCSTGPFSAFSTVALVVARKEREG